MLLPGYDRAVASARDEVLLRGLIDWVALERVHSRVARENPSEPLAVVQEKVLDLIRTLVTDGLYVIGDLATEDHRFAAWDTPLEESIQRIREVYTKEFDDESAWWFICWLDLTEKDDKSPRPLKRTRRPGDVGARRVLLRSQTGNTVRSTVLGARRIGDTPHAPIWVRLLDDADTCGGVVMSARDEVLLCGLID